MHVYPNYYKKFFYFFSLPFKRMNGMSINFDNKNIKKGNFYNKNKKTFNIDDNDINKILVSKKEQYGKHNSFKYFIGYNNNDVIRPFYLFHKRLDILINLKKIK